MLQSGFVKATNEFYSQEGLDFILLPITVGAVSSPMGLGSDSIPVKVNIDGIDTFLSDSMQFLLEYTCRINKKGGYYIAPSFRGEKADNRHLCQFFHSEGEIEGSLDDIIQLIERYLHYLVKYYLNYYSDEIYSITNDLTHLQAFDNLYEIPRCTFDEAVNILKNDPKLIIQHDGFRTISHWGEKNLIEYFEGAVWLTHFDFLSVPFYQKNAEDNQKAACADLLIGIGETVGAGERHLTGDAVKKALKHHKVAIDGYQWYIDMKDTVPMQTSGFGLGIERFLLWILKHDDIRDVQLIPRFNGETSVL